MEIVTFADRHVGEKVVVTGSLPPAGRDLDLLVGPAAEASLRSALAEAGFERKGHVWARFRSCSVDLVEPVPISACGLPERALQALFDRAMPLDGLVHLHRPAPHHVVLMLARRVGEGKAMLHPKRQDRLERAIAEDAEAWAKAEHEADIWGARRALSNLSRCRQGVAVGRKDHAAAIAERLESVGASRADAVVAAARAVKPRLPRGRIVAISGIDGSGKSTQIEHLSRILERMGMEAVRVWNRLAVNPSLRIVANPLKAIFNVLYAFRRDTGPPAGGHVDDLARAMRQRSDMITYSWTTVVALWNALSQRRTTQPHVLRGRVVLCDRYTLDSAVNLAYSYGELRNFSFHTRLIALISPRPVLSIFLDVDAQVAHERKPVKYEIDDLDRFVRLYRSAYAERPDVVRIDASATEEEICDQIARLVWRALP